MELGKFGRLGAITPAKILAAMIRKVDDWLSHLLSTVSRPVVAPLGTGPSVPIFFGCSNHISAAWYRVLTGAAGSDQYLMLYRLQVSSCPRGSLFCDALQQAATGGRRSDLAVPNLF
jgi:hypothetical protein